MPARICSVVQGALREARGLARRRARSFGSFRMSGGARIAVAALGSAAASAVSPRIKPSSTREQLPWQSVDLSSITARRAVRLRQELSRRTDHSLEIRAIVPMKRGWTCRRGGHTTSRDRVWTHIGEALADLLAEMRPRKRRTYPASHRHNVCSAANEGVAEGGSGRELPLGALGCRPARVSLPEAWASLRRLNFEREEWVCRVICSRGGRRDS